MAVLSVNVPDALVPRLVAACKVRYPDLAEGYTAAQVGKEALRRLLVEALADAERRAAEENGLTAARVAAENARIQAVTDGTTIT